jgi:hypothetical protein
MSTLSYLGLAPERSTKSQAAIATRARQRTSAKDRFLRVAFALHESGTFSKADDSTQPTTATVLAPEPGHALDKTGSFSFHCFLFSCEVNPRKSTAIPVWMSAIMNAIATSQCAFSIFRNA